MDRQYVGIEQAWQIQLQSGQSSAFHSVHWPFLCWYTHYTHFLLVYRKICKIFKFKFEFLPPAYVVRREGNSFTLSVHTWGGGGGGGYPYPIMLCNISQNAMRQQGGVRVPPPGGGGGVPGQVPPRGVWVPTPPGGYPVRYPRGGGGGGFGYPPGGGGTRSGQQKEYSLHGGRYASCVHAGGLSCEMIMIWQLNLKVKQCDSCNFQVLYNSSYLCASLLTSIDNNVNITSHTYREDEANLSAMVLWVWNESLNVFKFQHGYFQHEYACCN